MKPQADIMRDIDRLFGREQPEVARVCAAIVAFVSSQPRTKRLHLTYTALRIEATPQSDSDLLAALQFLTGAKIPLLEVQYEFVSEDGEYYPITRTVLASAERGQGFWHPETGESVDNYREQILVYFTPTEEARDSLMLGA